MALSTEKPLHVRDIPGVVSREETTWRGSPLRALYFLESKLESGRGADAPAWGPVVLLPGSWDPWNGEYSPALIKRLLLDSGAPVVLEGHYRAEGQDGYFDPGGVVKDLTDIFLDGESPPTVVGLCIAAPFLLEALLAACERVARPSVAGVMAIGNGVPGHLNRLGRITLRNYTSKTLKDIASRFTYSGHMFTSDNIIRAEEWFRNSRLVAALANEEDDPTPAPFPVPVETLYFRIDIATMKCRAQIRSLFGVPHNTWRIPGYHTSLRKPSAADDRIAQFYEATQQRATS